MSIFARHIKSALEASQAAALRMESAGVEDPLNGVVADAPVETDVDTGPATEDTVNVTAEQEANKQHGMIRSRLNADAEGDAGEEVTIEAEPEVPAVEETPAEIVDDSAAGDVDAVAAEDVAEAPVDATVDAPVENVDVDLVPDEATTAEPVETAEDGVVEAAPEADVAAEEPMLEEEPIIVPELPVEDVDPITDVVEPTGDVEFVSEDESEEDEEEKIDDEEIDDDLDETVGAIENDEVDMRQLVESMAAIEAYGINPTAMAIMQTTGLLNGTALESLGLEAFGFEKPESHESQMALEALGDKFKEKAAAWSAKILSVASSVGSKIMGVLTPLWNKIVGAAQLLTTTAWDATKVAGKVVKAHPYATIAATIAAVAAVGGIMVWTGASLPAFGAKPQALTAFGNAFKSKVDKIKWPFGKLDVSVVDGKMKAAYTAVAVPAKEAVSKTLGWSQVAVKSVSSQLSRAWPQVKDGANAIGARATKIAGSTRMIIQDTAESVHRGAGQGARLISDMATDASGSRGIGNAVGGMYYFTWLVSVCIIVRALVSTVVLGAFRVIYGTLRALTGLVTKPVAVAA